MIDAVIFDMDGTLLDTLEDLKESTNFVLAKFGFPVRTKEEIRQFVGDGVRLLFERAVPSNTNSEIVKECIDVFKKTYSKNMFNHTVPYNGILKILKELKLNEVKIGILSNKFDNAVKKMSKKYFDNLIDISIGQSDKIPKKPSPDGVLKIMKELKVKNAIFVGDSDVDILTAHNANIPCIGVSWGYRDNLQGADYIINSPEEIMQIVF